MLQSSHHIHLYEKMRSVFSDMSLFEDHVSEKLQLAILNSDNLVMTTSIVKKFAERYFTTSNSSNKLDKGTFRQIKLIFKTLCVYIVSQERRATDLFFHSPEELTSAYPEFHTLSPDEITSLLVFRNMVRASLLVIEARLNKQLIIDIAARLEGNQVKYITGSGQSAAVSRRVAIYRKESGIEPEKRPYRLKVSALPSSASKRKMPYSTPSSRSIIKVQGTTKVNRKRQHAITRKNSVPLVPQTPTQHISPSPLWEPLCDIPHSSSLSDMGILFEVEEVPTHDLNCGIPMICTPLFSPCNTSTFVLGELQSALDSEFYHDAANARVLMYGGEDELSQAVELFFPDLSERSWLTENHK